MLIPAIDLQGGRIVQLVQGERLALETSDIDGWVRRLERFPQVQLIDLDAAKGEGDNRTLISSICARLPCRVGGGIRSLERAEAVLAGGALKSFRVLCSARAVRSLRRVAGWQFGAGPDCRVDARDGQVVIHGWRTRLALTPADAMRALEPFFSEFLFTSVDVEGLMQGLDRPAIEAVRRATSRRVTAAGGVTEQADVDWLDQMGMDAVAGMAIYTGRLRI